MRKSRTALGVAMALSLSGCFQAQLNGPVSGAQITVNELRDPSIVLVDRPGMTEASVIAEKGAAEWNSFGNLVRLLHFGVVTDKLDNPAPQRFYLATAFGGDDFDWNQDNRPDASGTAVEGQWHAIMSGATVNNPENKVSALTEAVYQWVSPVLSGLSDDELAATLDRIAPNLVGDVDQDGDVDYTDVLEWSQLLAADAPLLKADPDVLAELAANIRRNGNLDRRRELAEQLIGEPVPGSQSADQLFAANIAEQVLDARCYACHIDGGVADNGGARLIFDNAPGPRQQANNIAAFEEYLGLDEGNAELLLSKVQGVGHGGGPVFGAFTPEYADLEMFLDVLAGGTGVGGAGGGLDAFWYGVTLAGPTKTLRRAAIILAGRLPTEAEYAQARSGDAGLRRAVRGLMQGDGFRDFLVTGANDRLHFSVFWEGLMQAEFLDPDSMPVLADRIYQIYAEEGGDEAYFPYERQLVYGETRGALELIAHVVMNDRPYTEILTADYTMVNPQMAYVHRTGVSFPSDDHRLFKPGQYKGRVYQDEQFRVEYTTFEGFSLGQILSHSGFRPRQHAGILNDPAFLVRYPTTETNRNRARARWAYYHFLGVDIEQSASRTTDPDALADTNNPTLNNPACTVCHERMDPVAGAFQSYDEWGRYRNNGMDALPDTYKYPEWFDESAPPSPYRFGDTWFRDMRAPGFEGARAPSTQNSIQWLAHRIVEDPRFASASVAFWWPALMGAEVLEAPGSPSDPNYTERLRAFDAQQASIEAFAEGLRNKQYNLKTLLVDMVTSPWFRADSVDPAIAETRAAELAGIGTGRLLTPEELERKTRAIFGKAWGEWPDPMYQLDGVYTSLLDMFRIYYGGIDSLGVKERARALTPLMTNVANRQANEMTCSVVGLDFLRPAAQRSVFTEVDQSMTPLYEVGREFGVAFGAFNDTRQYRLNGRLSAGNKRIGISFLNDGYNEETQEDRNLFIEKVQLLRGGQVVATYEGEDFPNLPGYGQSCCEDGPIGDVFWDDTPQGWREVGWLSWTQGTVFFDLPVSVTGQYEVVVTAWGSSSGDGMLPQMVVAVESRNAFGNSVGSQAIRRQLQALHSTLLGVELPLDHPEIEAAYRMLVERWQERQTEPYPDSFWNWPQDDCLVNAELTDDQWYRMTQDGNQMKSAWTTVLSYLLTHYDYLHE